MRDNEEFLAEVLNKSGRTNLGDYFINYLREKDSTAQREKMKGVMLPPSLLDQ
jgi:hypothetical protein